MELLNRYLTEVKKHLPKKDRDEIIMELKSSILDQFEQTEQTEKDMQHILVDLGSPQSVASNYNSRPLFSSQIEPLYKLLLKIVSAAVVGGIFVAKIAELIFSGEPFSIAAVITHLAIAIPSIIMALISVVGSVTIIMFIIDRKVDIREEPFHISKLPKVDRPFTDISRIEEGVKLAFVPIFIVMLLIFDPAYTINGMRVFADIEHIIVFALGLAILEVMSSIYNLIIGYRNRVSTIFYVVKEILSIGFLVYLTSTSIFSDEFTLLPSFVPYLIKLVFLGIAVLSVVELRKVKGA